MHVLVNSYKKEEEERLPHRAMLLKLDFLYNACLI